MDQLVVRVIMALPSRIVWLAPKIARAYLWLVR
jgi:hypothetical protein